MALAHSQSSYIYWASGYPETAATGAARQGVVSHVSMGLRGQARLLPAGPRTLSPPLPAGPRTKFPTSILEYLIIYRYPCAPRLLVSLRSV